MNNWNSWLWNYPPREEWRRLLLESVVIVALGVLIGLSANVELLRQVLAGEAPRGDVRQEAPLPEPVALDEVQELLAAGALAVDARLPELYAAGHLPQAYNLPLAEFDAAYPAFAAAVEKGRVVVLYCNGYGCPDSFDLAQLLQQRGYRKVRVFEGGFPEWRDAGLTVERSAS